MNFKYFNLENLRFRDNSLFRLAFLSIGLPPPRPVDFKEKKYRFWEYPSLAFLAGAVGFDSIEAQKVISLHNRQFILYRVLLLTFITITYMFFIIFVVYPLSYYVKTLNSFLIVQELSVILIFFFASYIIIALSSRLYYILASQYFSESLCVASILYVIIDLSRDDILIRPDRKKILLFRTNFMAKWTFLLASSYARINKANQPWLERHFKEIELFIRERERWVAAPQDNTLINLRKDFYELADLYISGNYGSFSWQLSPDIPKPVTPNWRQRMVSSLPRFIGVVLPLLVMGVYLWQPSLFPFIQLNTDIITFIFIAWLLLAIDSSFDLGVVNGVTNLAKGIKDLT
jgi:hypothetical protein